MKSEIELQALKRAAIAEELAASGCRSTRDTA